MIRFDLLVNDAFDDPRSTRRPEHGLSILAHVEPADGQPSLRLLLDTGQHAKTLSSNIGDASCLGNLDAVVLSHGHYDHSGGLSLLADAGIRCPLYMGPDAERRRFSVQVGPDGQLGKMRKPIGMPTPEILDHFDVRRVSGVHVVSPFLTLFTLPRPAPPNPRLLAADMLTPDSFSDELFALISDGNDEWLFGGCTHHGLPMLLRFVFNDLGRSSLAGFIGGLHLQGRPLDEIEAVAADVEHYNVAAWRIVHCTGDDAQAVWRRRFNVI